MSPEEVEEAQSLFSDTSAVLFGVENERALKWLAMEVPSFLLRPAASSARAQLRPSSLHRESRESCETEAPPARPKSSKSELESAGTSSCEAEGLSVSPSQN